MKVLIIPDIHNRIDVAEKIIGSVKPDQTIFLGDVFDDFHDTPDIARKVAMWFRESVHRSDRIHLVGNHDTHYWFKDNSALRCSGYEYAKSIAINDIVTLKEWEKLKWFHVIDDTWLLSHAGFHPSILGGDAFHPLELSTSTLKHVVKRLNRDVKEANKALYAKGGHWFTRPGFSRSSSPFYGGLTWCDWNDEFIPIKGVNQIVGHTPSRRITWKNVEKGDTRWKQVYLENNVVPVFAKDTSYNICLDTHPGSQYYAIYEHGKLQIHKTCDLK
jgi:hypothetical protein